MSKKIFLAQLGAPCRGYEFSDYEFQGKSLNRAIAFSIIPEAEDFDRILVIGTEKSFDPTLPHYAQYEKEVKKPYGDRLSEKVVGTTETPEKFWKVFQEMYVEITQLCDNQETEIHADITYGYRNQSLLMFLLLYYISEIHHNIRIGKIYYNRLEPGKIIDFSEIIQLIQWTKALQNFEKFHSLEQMIALIENIADKENRDHGEFIKNLRLLHDSYVFNYAPEIFYYSKESSKQWGTGSVRNLVSRSKPLHITSSRLGQFFRIWEKAKELRDFVPGLIRNFLSVEDYSKALILIREYLLIILQQFFGLKNNRPSRELVENRLMNQLCYLIYPEEYSGMQLSEDDRNIANGILLLLNQYVGTEMVKNFFGDWLKIRKFRNRAAHVKNINKGELTTNFNEIKSDIVDVFSRCQTYQEKAKDIIQKKEYIDKINKIINEILERNKKKSKKLFLIVNEGLHPIKPLLEKQFGKDIHTEIITRGNVGNEDERTVARRTIEILDQYPGFTFYIVPSGYQYLGLTVYNVVQQKTSKHPIWLHYDRENQKYIEKQLDPRKLIFE